MTHGTTIGDNLRPKLIASLVAACFAAPHVAEANPVGASVAVGQATFATQGSTLNVTNTPGAVINWQGFSIGSGETTRFIQQSAASSVLNRVLGADPSVILGNLQSNGKVFLINPAGIMVGQGARIDVAGFVASTLNISNQDFANGRLSFQSNPMAGSVSNAGLITTPEGGNVFLVAPNVSNTGVITAQQGQVILAAGNSVQLVDTGAPGVRVEVTTSENNKAENLGTIIANSGKVGIVGALVRNSGRINADQVTRGADGKVYLRAKKDVTLDASSVITANGERGGDISIQAETGTALVSGRVEATGSAGKGGSLKALGQFVGLTAASLDASGSAGGGSVLVGGDFQGRNPEVQNAWRTFVGSDVSVKADAASQGDGGKVIVWADDTTRYNGSISVKGGADGGNGGFVEVSGKHQLIFRGTVDTSAANGRAGSLLLDPQDIVIANGSGGANDAALSDNSVDSGDANSTTDVTISEQALEGLTGSVTLLASRDVILQHMVDGNLTLSGVTNGSNLTITAGRNISGVNVNDRFVTNGGGIAFTTTNGYIDIGGVLTNGGAVSMTAGGSGGNVVVREIKTTPGGGNGGNINLVAGGIASLGGGNIDARGSGSNGNVTINSSGAIYMQSGTTIYANDLNLTAVGGISDGSSGALTLNATRIRAFNSGSGNIILTNTGTGDIEISDLELSGSGIQNSAASGSVTISASQAKLKVSKAITANAGDITLVSDRMDIADVINSGSSSTGTVTLRPWNNGTAIDLGSSVDSTNSTLELSQTELAKVTAGVLRIGDTPYTGGINITQNLNISTASSFSLLNNADIGVTGSQTITTSKLKVASNGTVALAGNNSVGTLSGTYGSSSNTFTYKNAGALTVGTVDSTSGIAGDGNLTLDTGTGAMTVSSSLNAGAGPIALTTAGSSNNINFGSGVTVTGGSLTLAGTGSAALNSGTVTLNAPVTSTAIPLSIGGATVNFNGATNSINNLTITGGTLQGTGNVTVNTSGTFSWTNGAVAGSGTLTTQTGVATTLSPGFAQTVSLKGSETWDNYGTVTFTPNSGTLSYFQIDDTTTGGTAVFNNKSGGIFNINASFSDTHIIGVGTFNNAGELRKSLNTSVATVGFQPVVINQAGGAININSGTLRFDAAAVDTGGNYTLANSATLAVNASRTITGNISGSGNVAFSTPLSAGPFAQIVSGDYNITGATTANFSAVGTSNLTFNGTVSNIGSSLTYSGASADTISFTGISSGEATGFDNLTSISATGGNVTLKTGTSLAALTSLNRGTGSGTLNLGNTALNGLTSLSVSGGALTSSAAMTVGTGGSGFTWSGGTITGTGSLTTNGNSTLNGGTKVLLTKTWTNAAAGNITWSAGGLQIDNGATLNNAGLFTTSGAVDIINSTGSASTINNTGTWTKSGGGNSNVGPPNQALAFNNTGTVNVTSGTLQLWGDGTDTGDYNIAGSQALVFRGGTRALNSGVDIATSSGTGSLSVGGGTTSFNAGSTVNSNITFTSSGGTANINTTAFSAPTVSITGGTTNFNQNVTLTKLTETAGVLAGTGNVTLTGSGANKSSWSTGSIEGSGTLFIASGAELDISSSLNYLLGSQVIDNSGNITLSGVIRSAANARIDNQSGGLIDVTADVGSPGFSYGRINNFSGAIFRKSAGSGTAYIEQEFNNAGTVQIQSGRLELLLGNSASGALTTHTGSFVLSGGTKLGLSYTGTNTFTSASSISETGGAGSIIAATTATINGAFGLSGNLTVSGGTFTLNPTDTSVSLSNISLTGGTLSLGKTTSVADMTVTGTLTGAGNVTVTNGLTWNGGTITGAGLFTTNSGVTTTFTGGGLNGRTFNNNGTLNFNTGAGYLAFDGTNATFNNAGTFNWNSPSTFEYICCSASGAIFNNTGTLNFNATSSSYNEVPLNNQVGGVINVLANTFDQQSTFTQAGTLNVSSGATFKKLANISNTGVLAGGGTIDATGFAVTSTGTIRPGGNGAAGTLTITANSVNLTGGTTEIELASTGSYDKLLVNGNVTLGSSTLKYGGISGYGGASGDSFADVIKASGSNTMSGNVTLAQLTVTSTPDFDITHAVTTGAGGNLTLTMGGLYNYWNGATDSLWSTNTNWSRSHSPLSTEGAVINLAGTNTVYLNADGSAKTLSISSNNTVSIGQGVTYVAPTLTVASGITNNGTIDLVNANGCCSAIGSTLVVTSGTLTNNGTLRSSGSYNVFNTVDAQVANLGTIQADRPLSITNAGRTLVSDAGTLNIASGQTLRVTDGTTTLGAGTTFAGTGTLSLTGTPILNLSGNLTLPASSITLDLNGGSAATVSAAVSGKNLTVASGASLTLDGDTIASSVNLVNHGSVIANAASSAVNGALTNDTGASIFIGQGVTYNAPTLTVASGFTNDGTIDLVNANGCCSAIGSTLVVTSGTLTNNGTLRSSGSYNVFNTVDAQVTNAGTIQADRPLSMTNAGRTLVSDAGALNIASGQTLRVTDGTTTLGSGTTFAGTGTLSLTGTPILNLSGNLTIPGASGVAFDLNGGNATNITASTPVTLTVPSGGTLTLNKETIASNISVSNLGTILVDGSQPNTINGAFSNASGATLKLFDTTGSPGAGVSNLTIANGFTNNGLIDLWTNIGGCCSQGWAELTVTSGTLTNSATGTIRSEGAWAQTNKLFAQVANLGTIDVQRPLTISNLPTNNGTISLSVNNPTLTLTNANLTNNSTGLIQGTGTVSLTSMTNNGTISPGASGVPGTLTIASNITNNSGAMIAGSGTLGLSGNTLTNYGTINPGGAGTVANLTLSGNLVQGSNGTIALDLGGTGANQYDQLAVTGTASLNGTLSLSTANGYVNNPGDSLTGVLTYASQTGTFSSVTSSAFSPTLTYGSTSLDLLMQILQNSWIGTGGGSWYTTSNWSLNHAPTSAEDVIISDSSAAALITILGGTTAARSITMTGDDMLSIDTGANLTFAQPSSFTGSTTLRVTSGGALNVNGTLTAANMTQSGGTTNINAATTLTRLNLSGGQITGAGNLTVTNNLSDSGGGNISLSGALSVTQAVGDLVLSSQLTGSTVSLTSTSANLSLANTAVHGTTTYLSASSGQISQGASGAVVATTLQTTSGGSTSMSGSGNQFANASLYSGGGMSLFDTTGFDITALSGAGNVSLSTNGGITQSGAITNTSGLSIAAAGPVTLTNTGNTFSSFGGSSTSGALSVVTSTGTLGVNALSANGAVSLDNRGGGIAVNGTLSSAASVVLLANGAISQSQNISTPQVYAATFGSGYNITLNNGSNSIGNVDLRALNAVGTAGSTGAIDFRTSGSLAIGSAGYGIVTGGNAKIVAGGPISQTTRVDAISFDVSAVGGINLPSSLNDVNSLSIFNSGSGAVVYNNAETTMALTGISQSGGGGVTIANNGAITTSGTLSNSGGAMLLAATGGFSGSGNVSATGSVGLFGTGLSSSGTVSSTSGAITLDARTGLLTLGGVVTGNGQAVNLYGGDMAISALVNNPTGNIVVNNMSGGAVTLGGGLAGFGLSNAELNLLKAANLTLNLSPATVDGAVNLSGVGALNINATSLAVNNSFSTSGALTIDCTSDVSVNASSSAVSLSASSLSINAGNVILNGGTLSGASAKLVSTSGALNVSTPSTGSLKLVSGTGGAGLQSAGNLVVNTGTCANCTGNLVAGGTLSVVQTAPVTTTNTTAVVETVVTQQQQSLVSTVITSTNNATADSNSGTTSDTSGTVGTGSPPAGSGGSTVLLASAGSTPQPLKTDPNGVTGGDAGSFGGSSGGSTGDSNASGGSGTSGSSGSNTANSGGNGSNDNKDSKDDKDGKSKQGNKAGEQKTAKKAAPKNSCAG